jgi:FAD synthase
VVTKKTGDSYVVEFEARTTKTRASSMVTRVRLIANEVVVGPDFTVGKELLSEPPADRSALATWRVFVKIAIRKKKLEEVAA